MSIIPVVRCTLTSTTVPSFLLPRGFTVYDKLEGIILEMEKEEGQVVEECMEGPNAALTQHSLTHDASHDVTSAEMISASGFVQPQLAMAVDTKERATNLANAVTFVASKLGAARGSAGKRRPLSTVLSGLSDAPALSKAIIQKIVQAEGLQMTSIGDVTISSKPTTTPATAPNSESDLRVRPLALKTGFCLFFVQLKGIQDGALEAIIQDGDELCSSMGAKLTLESGLNREQATAQAILTLVSVLRGKDDEDLHVSVYSIELPGTLGNHGPDGRTSKRSKRGSVVSVFIESDSS